MNPQTIPSVSLFASVRGRRERRTLAGLADTLNVPAHKTLAREGDLAREFFVILDGYAVASREGEQIAVLGPGDFFGEIGLLGDVRRTATVSSGTPMELLVVSVPAFRAMLDAFPAIREQVERAAAERAPATADLLAA